MRIIFQVRRICRTDWFPSALPSLSQAGTPAATAQKQKISVMQPHFSLSERDPRGEIWIFLVERVLWRCTNYKRRFLPAYTQACPCAHVLCPARRSKKNVCNRIKVYGRIHIVHKCSYKAGHRVWISMCDLKYGIEDVEMYLASGQISRAKSPDQICKTMRKGEMAAIKICTSNNAFSFKKSS